MIDSLERMPVMIMDDDAAIARHIAGKMAALIRSRQGFPVLIIT